MKHKFTFYVEPSRFQSEQVQFSRAESHHLSSVLRMKRGDQVEAVDGKGYIYSIQLLHREAGCWRGRILSRRLHEVTTPIPACIALPCLKGDRWEIALDAACEMGIQEVWLVDFKSASITWTKARQERAKRKAVEALKQSVGGRLTEILGPATLPGVIEACPTTPIWLADPTGGVMPASLETPLIVVGPEAGLHPEEEEYLTSKRVHRFSLGKRRLRSEIAVVAALTQLIQKTP